MYQHQQCRSNPILPKQYMITLSQLMCLHTKNKLQLPLPTEYSFESTAADPAADSKVEALMWTHMLRCAELQEEQAMRARKLADCQKRFATLKQLQRLHVLIAHLEFITLLRHCLDVTSLDDTYRTNA